MPSHPSVPSFIPFPHFCQTDRDQSGPDSASSSSKRNHSSFQMPGERELKQIKKELGGSDLRPDWFLLYQSPFMLFPLSHFLVPKKQKSCKITNIIKIWKYIEYEGSRKIIMLNVAIFCLLLFLIFFLSKTSIYFLFRSIKFNFGDFFKR